MLAPRSSIGELVRVAFTLLHAELSAIPNG